MFKKLMIVLALIFVATACADSAESKTVDLSGTWSTSTEDGFKMTADVQNDGITVYWHQHDTKALYWQGTLPNSSTVSNGEKLRSVADKAALETSMFASTADDKEFTYKDGKLSYDFTVRGITQTLHLKR